MAIRYREKYKSWQVYYKHPATKKIVSKSFKTKEEAEKENSLISYKLKYDRESFLEEKKEEGQEEQPEQNSEVVTVEQVYLQYLTEKQFSKLEVSRHFTHMKVVLKIIGATEISTITTKDLENVKSLLMQDDVSPATIHKRLSQLRTLMYYAAEKGYCDRIHFPKIPNPNYKQFVPPSQEELAQMVQAAPPHIQRVIIIGAYIGARIGECELFQLTWDDVDFSKNILRVHGSKKNANAQWREVPIRESLVPIFRQWQARDIEIGTNFLISYNGKPVKQIKRSWKTMLKNAGITRRIRPYDLRHAFGTELVSAGVDIGTVAKLMGHSNPMMLLQHYQYVMDKQKRNAVEILPPPPPIH